MASGRNSEILQKLRTILRRDLKLAADDPLPEDMPFFGGDVDLDSLDMLLLVTSLERELGVRIPNEAVGKEVFQSVGTLADYVAAHQGEAPTGPRVVTPPPIDWLARLPHGPEFRFISRIVEVRPGESARGIWAVTGSEPFLAGHFPGNPIVPGVLIGEALAQLAGLMAATGPAHGTVRAGKLAQIDLRFEQSATPPADIELSAKLVRQMGQLQLCEVTAQLGDRVLARGNITIHLGGV